MCAIRTHNPSGSSKWTIPLYSTCGLKVQTNLDTQSRTNIIPLSFYEALLPPFKPELAPLTEPTLLTTFDGNVATSQIMGSISIPLHLLAHVAHKGELVPQVFERVPEITAYVVKGVSEAFIGFPTLQDPESAFSLFNAMLTDPALEIRFPRGPSRVQLPPPIPLAAASASGFMDFFNGAPHDAGTNSPFEQDHPGLDNPPLHPSTIDDVLGWEEVTGIPEEFDAIKAPFAALLHKYQDLFGPIPATEDCKLPFLDMPVKAGTKPNVQGKARRCAPKHYEATLKQVLKLHSAGLIAERTGSKLPADFWFNALVITPKYDEFTGRPTDEVRITMDGRYFNEHSDTPPSKLPGVTDFSSDFLGCALLSVGDFTMWFHQFRILARCRHLTGFILHAPDGTARIFEWLSGPMGWAALPGIAQEILQDLLQQLTGLDSSTIKAYIDNLVLGTRPVGGTLADFNVPGSPCREITLSTHLAAIEQFFSLCRKHSLRLKRGKLRFFRREARSLGLLFTGSEVSLDPSRIADWLALRVPPKEDLSIKWLEQTLGSFNWMRGMLHPGGSSISEMFAAIHKFRKDYAVLSNTLTEAKNSKRLVHTMWTEAHTTAFNDMKKSVAKHQVRAIPDYTKRFYFRGDACDTGWACMLLQADPVTGALKMVSYYCGAFTEAAASQKTNHREACAIIFGVRAIGNILSYMDWVLQTDHNNIRYWHNSSDPVMQRWWAEISKFNPPIQHIEGADNPVADAGSRFPNLTPTPDRPISSPSYMRVAAISTRSSSRTTTGAPPAAPLRPPTTSSTGVVPAAIARPPPTASTGVVSAATARPPPTSSTDVVPAATARPLPTSSTGVVPAATARPPPTSSTGVVPAATARPPPTSSTSVVPAATARPPSTPSTGTAPAATPRPPSMASTEMNWGASSSNLLRAQSGLPFTAATPSPASTTLPMVEESPSDTARPSPRGTPAAPPPSASGAFNPRPPPPGPSPQTVNPLPPPPSRAAQLTSLLADIPDFRGLLPTDPDPPVFSPEQWLHKVLASQLLHNTSTFPPVGRKNSTFCLSQINGVSVYTLNGAVVIPAADEALLQEVLHRAHDAAGHPAQLQTLINLKPTAIANVASVVERYISSCPACQHGKAPGSPPKEGSMSAILPAARPFAHIIMDYAGPVSTPGINGEKYILSFTDLFSRHVWWVASKAADSQTSISLFKQYVQHRGTLPSHVQLDNGKHFGSPFKTSLAADGIQVHTTRPYHAQSNGKDERGHHVLWTMLTTMLTPGHLQEWPTLLPHLCFIKNNRANRDIGGLSPHEVIHGHRARAPLDLLTGLSGLSVSPQDMAALITSTQERASISDALSAMRSKLSYDGARSPPKSLALGDTVLVWYPTRPSKLHSYWQGPYKVVSGIDPHGFYKVAEMQAHGGQAPPIDVISHRLMYYDMTRTSFEEEAQRDLPPGEFIISSIINHRPSDTHAGEIEFQVKFLGLDTPSWQGVRFLTGATFFKTYCQTHKISASSMKKQKLDETSRS